MNIKGVIFDLDGTLLDTLEDIANSMNEALEEMGLPIHELSKYRGFVGDGVQVLAKRVLPEERRDARTIALLTEKMMEIYETNWNKHTRPYPGVENLLNTLKAKGIHLAVFSNKPHEFATMAVDEYFGNSRFDIVWGTSPDIPRKPNPRGVLKILEEMKIAKENFFYLGDTNTDMKTAKAARLYAIGVTWGFRSREELEEAGADWIIDHPMQLMERVS